MERRYRKNKAWHLAIIGAAVLGLAACSGGGSSDSAAAATTPTPAAGTTTLTGQAVAGPISGQACAYQVSDTGTVATATLGCATTNATTGAYSISFTGYAGSVMVKAFGTYLDEATGQSKTIAEAQAIRAIVACATAGAACKAAVTPLTEAALRSAGTLTMANVEAAYLKVAQAYGMNPASSADAVSKITQTIPDFTSRNDAAAAKYADILTLASQAQASYCGSGSSCSLDNYLSAVKTMMGGNTGVTDVQTAMNTAMSSWASNPLNTAKLACSMSSGAITCTLPAGGTGSTPPSPGGTTGSTAGTASGTATLTITVSANGVATPAIVINNVPKPGTQAAFCGDATVTQQLNAALDKVGTWTLNSCSFSGSSGTIAATINLTSPITISIPYTVAYQYSS